MNDIVLAHAGHTLAIGAGGLSIPAVLVLLFLYRSRHPEPQQDTPETPPDVPPRGSARPHP